MNVDSVFLGGSQGNCHPDGRVLPEGCLHSLTFRDLEEFSAAGILRPFTVHPPLQVVH